MRRHRLRTPVAAALAAILTLGMASAATAQADDLKPVPDAIHMDAQPRVPIVETTIGRGTLPTDGTAIALPSSDGYASALIRVAVFDASEDTTVSAGGFPVLAVPAGASASQTTLLPIVDGEVTLTADRTVDARIETLALLQGDTDAPGATNTIAQPVVRADTEQGLACDALTSDPIQVGLGGQGGVPATDVRAAWVTMEFDADREATVTADGQTMDIPAGRSVVSTIVTPDPGMQDIDVSSDRPVDGFRLAVRGWVTDAEQDDEHANTIGSYVPATQDDWTDADATPAHDARIGLDGPSDRAVTFTLVSAEPTGDPQARSFVDTGIGMIGRSRGALVDPTIGALPQIDIIPSTSADALVSARGSDVSAHVRQLGVIIGEKPAVTGAAGVTIDTLRDGTAIDLAATGGVAILEGSVSSDAAIDTVTVKTGGELIGTADIDYTGDGAEWSLETGAPQSGTYTFDVTATARDGATATTSISLDLTAMDGDDDVINRNVVVATDNVPADDVTDGTPRARTAAYVRAAKSNDKDQARKFLPLSSLGKVDGNRLYFTSYPYYATSSTTSRPIRPGMIIAADATDPKTPDGLLKKVKSLDAISKGEYKYVVRTEDAKLNQAIVQNPKSNNFVKSGYENQADNIDSVTGKWNRTKAISDEDQGLETEDGKIAVACGAIAVYNKPDDTRIGCYKPSKIFSEIADLKTKAKEEDTAGGVSAFASAALETKLTFKLEIASPWDWGIHDSFVKIFKISFDGKAHEELDLEAWGHIERDVNAELYSLKNKTYTITVAGFFPVVITPSLDIDLVGHLEAEAEISYHPEWDQTLSYGFKYEHGKWEKIDRFDPNGGGKPDPCPEGVSVDGELDAVIGPRFQPGISLYGMVGATLNLLAQVGVNVTADNDDGVQPLLVSMTPRLHVDADALVYFKAPWSDEFFADTQIDVYSADIMGKKAVIQIGDAGGCTPGDEAETRIQIQGSVSDGYEDNTNGTAISRLPGVRVEARPVGDDDADPYVAYTDEDGVFTIDVPDGTYELTLSKDGYVKTTARSDGITNAIEIWPEVGAIDEYDVTVTYHNERTDCWGAAYIGGYYKLEDAWTQVLDNYPSDSLTYAGYTNSYETNYDTDSGDGRIHFTFHQGRIGGTDIQLGNMEYARNVRVTIRRNGEVIKTMTTPSPDRLDEHGSWWPFSVWGGEPVYDTIPDWAK